MIYLQTGLMIARFEGLREGLAHSIASIPWLAGEIVRPLLIDVSKFVIDV
jgi:hypothetical protein